MIVFISYKYFFRETIKNEAESKVATELTMNEAIEIGRVKVKEWSKEANLLKIISQDETMGGTRGETGKRYIWNLYFSDPKKW
ncbi:hypothetical protein PAJ34TS1_30110 [Paenibacillus azoreducens]